MMPRSKIVNNPKPLTMVGSPSICLAPLPARKKVKYGQKYNVNWESDPSFSKWIEKSSKGPTFAFCKSCVTDISVVHSGKTGLTRHATAAHHIKCVNRNAPIAKIRYGQNYNVNWESDPSFCNWIGKSSKGPTFAFCRSCLIHISVSHSGKTGLTKHTKTAKHLKSMNGNVALAQPRIVFLDLAMSSEKDFIQLATYHCPSIPVEYFELIAAYIEAQLGKRTTLLYDSRNLGPAVNKGDDKHIDIAFVPTSTYMQNYRHPDSSFQLLPVGVVSEHPVKGETLGYYTDLILHRNTIERVKMFLDLRGSLFAYSQESSISSAKQLLLMLKQSGENASFFSNVKACGNHMATIERVLAKKAECATVSSIAYCNFLKQHSYLESDLCLFDSFGPLPPDPILVNKSLPTEIVDGIEKALLRLHATSGWNDMLKKFGFTKFETISEDTYLPVTELLKTTSSLSIGVTYY